MGCGNSKQVKTQAEQPERREPETQPGNEKDDDKGKDEKLQNKNKKVDVELDEEELEAPDEPGQLEYEQGYRAQDRAERQKTEQELREAQLLRNQNALVVNQDGISKKNVHDLSDLPLYRQENPNFEFNEGELSPITTPTGSKKIKTIQDAQPQQEVKPMPKKIVVKRQKVTPFNWGNEGRVEIKSISFKIKYNFLLKSFKTIKSKDDYQTTILSWIKDEEEDVLVFTLKDTFLTNLRTGIDQPLNSPQLEFHVDPDGKFVKISNLDEFTDKMLEIQGKKEVVTKKQRKRFKKLLDRDFHRNWNLFVEDWLYINKPEGQDLVVDEYEQYGTNVMVTNRLNMKDEEEIKESLKQVNRKLMVVVKLLNEKTYYKLIGSKNMVRDKYKKWRLHEDSSKKESKFTSEDDEPKHRNLRLNFFLTQKYDSTTALIDSRTIRPFVTSSESARKVVFDVNRDLYVDVEYESKQNLFMWDETAMEMNMDDYLVEEMVKFQDQCNEALQDMIEELSEINRVPLVVKFKKPKIEDEKMEGDENDDYYNQIAATLQSQVDDPYHQVRQQQEDYNRYNGSQTNLISKNNLSQPERYAEEVA